MAYKLRCFSFCSILLILQAEWIEIAQKPNEHRTTSKPKTNIRLLKNPQADVLFHSDSNTPSPQWLEYQRERFGNRQNSNSQKLIVTSGQKLKNSAKIIVPANTNNARLPQTTERNQIFQTKSRLNVVNNKPMESLVELPHLEPQTTTKRDMNDGSNQDYEYVEIEEDPNAQDEAVGGESTNQQPNNGETNQNNIEGPSWQGFLKFLKNVRNNWVKHSGISIKSKIQFLKNIRDSLMRKIENQFTMIWQPKEFLRRRKRGLLDESNINFPPETALITINFLTFAVFLIKLVLKVVHIIKSKHYNITELGVIQPFGKTTIRA